ncbi:MAG: glycosyltransferase family 2 protein [Cyanothece sp. SIO1E1]|nr:glycosyltransferase family 2 protein [Cyanothece sp. SIO1E1]
MFSRAEHSISVVIPVHNGGEAFRQCLASLALAAPAPLEVIVVVDGDTDSSWQVAEEFGATVIRISHNGGPAKARNLGAKVANGEILFFVDADVAIHPDTLGRVEDEFRRSPNLTALIGSYDDAPGAPNFLSQYKNLFHHYTHQTAQTEASTFWGACGAIRRDVFWKVGGFDENYRRPCVEDIELGYRLKQLGYEIRLCKSLEVKHLKRWGIVSLLKADFFYRALPWTALILRDRQFNNDLNLNVANRISVVLVYCLLMTLVAAWWWPIVMLLAVPISLMLLGINRPVYQFFRTKRGLRFALQTILWHWFYYFYGGLAFAIGLVRHQFRYHNMLVINQISRGLFRG